MILTPEKALIIIIFLYAMSFSVLAAQYMIGDVFRLTLTSPITNQPIKSALLGDTNNPGGIIQYNKLNAFQQNLNTTKPFNVVNAITTTYSIGWELFLLLTGFYIFNFLYLFGISFIIIIPMIVIYIMLLVRAVLALVRGY